MRISRSMVLVVLVAASCNTAGPSRPTTTPSAKAPSGAATSPGSAPGIAPTWRSLAVAPVAQEEIATAAVGGGVFVAGGFLDGGTTTSGVLRYDIASDRWAAVAALPVAVHHPAGVAYRNEFVVIGGFTQGSNASNRVWHYDGRAWRQMPSLGHARGAAAAVAIGDRIIVAGGKNDSGHVAVTEVFDGTRWHDAEPIPVPRDHLSMTTDGRVAWAALGRSSAGHLNTFESYDPDTDAWTALPSVPTTRSGAGAAFVKGRVVVLGGEGSRIFGEVEAYDPVTKTWTRLPAMPVPRHGIGVATSDNTVFVMCGGTRPGLAPTGVSEALRF